MMRILYFYMEIVESEEYLIRFDSESDQICYINIGDKIFSSKKPQNDAKKIYLDESLIKLFNITHGTILNNELINNFFENNIVEYDKINKISKIILRTDSKIIEDIKKYLNNKVVNVKTTIYLNNNIYQIINIVDENKNIDNGYITSETIFELNNELVFKSIRCENIGGMDEEMRNIINHLVLPRIIDEKPSKGCLLYGPPGCGKTLLVRNIAKIINCKNVSVINGPEILSKWQGQSESNLRTIFNKFTNELHIIIFDEIDSIASIRNNDNDPHGAKIINQLLTLMDGYILNNNIIIFGTTNRKDILDPAILRSGRLDLHIEIKLPNKNKRKDIFRVYCKDDIFDYDLLAENTEGYSGADIESLINKTKNYVKTKYIDYDNFYQSVQNINYQITTDDILQFIKKKNVNEKKIICVYGKYPDNYLIEYVENYENSIILNSEQLLTFNDIEKIKHLQKIFNENYDIIAINEIEYFIDFIALNIFNSKLLNCLRVLFKNTKKNIIFTTKYFEDLSKLKLFENVDEFEKK